LCELAPQRVGRNEVDERPRSVDLDDGNQLAIARLELGIPVDRHLLELEPELVAGSQDGLASALAEMAARRPVEPN
jgi:hypothetical protein